jgi:uncharacterized protein with GYD domain
MIRAVILMKSGGRVPRAAKLATELEGIPSVTEAHAVFGRYDIVAFLESEDINELFRSASEATKLNGVMSSETLIEALENKETSQDYGRGPFVD